MTHVHHGQTLFTCDLGAATVAEVLYRPWTDVKPHVHGGAQLALVFDGEMTEGGDGCDQRIVGGTALFRPAGVPHTNTFFDAETRGVIFELREPPTALRALMSRVHRTSLLTSAAVRRVCGKVRRELSSTDAASPVALEGLAFELAATLFRSLSAMDAPSWVDDVKARIAQSRRRHVDERAIARDIGLTTREFIDAFRRAAGCTPAEHARQCSLDFAKTLLRESRQSLSAIAADSGFYDQAHFTRAFKRATGWTPLDYRRAPIASIQEIPC